MLNTPVEDKLFQLLGSFKTGMLITHRETGACHARPMAVAQIERNGTLWFITDVDSGKVQEIQSQHAVHVTFQDNKDDRFISLSGQAELIRDRSTLELLWNDAFKTWFPDGVQDPNIALIKVTVEEAEYWDAEYWDEPALTRAKGLFESARAYVTGTQPEDTLESVNPEQQQHYRAREFDPEHYGNIKLKT